MAGLPLSFTPPVSGHVDEHLADFAQLTAQPDVEVIEHGVVPDVGGAGWPGHASTGA